MPILLCNPSSEEITIEPYTTIGRLVNVFDVSDPIDLDDIESCGVKNCCVDTISVSDEDPLPDHLQCVYENSILNLDDCQKLQLRKFLVNYSDLFSESDRDIGRTPLVKHKIITSNEVPIKQAPRRQHPAARDAADEIVKDLLARDLIKPSNSAWALPIVIVKKRDGSYRLCIDYCALNSVTVKDAYPLLHIDETLDSSKCLMVLLHRPVKWLLAGRTG